MSFLTANADEDTRREFYRINLHRLVLIGPLFFLMELSLLPLDRYLLGVTLVVKIFLVLNVLVYPFVYHANKHQDRMKEWSIRLAVYAYILLIMGLGSGLSLKGLMSTDLVHVFLMTIVTIAIFFILPALDHLILILLGVIPYLLIYPHLLIHKEIEFVIINNVIVFALLSWLFGRLVFTMNVRSLITSRTLEAQNRLLADLAIKDPMTGLLNHGASQERLRKAIDRAKQNEGSLSLLLFDIDDFKGINDTWGHLVGDEVIRKIASAVKDSVNVDDEVGRYGGDEFIVIMPHTSIQGARVVAAKIWNAMDAITVPDTDITVTLSGGIEVLIADEKLDTEQAATDMVAHSDIKLFKAKERGKNRFISEPVA